MSVLEGFWKYIIANFAMDFGTGVAFIQEGCIFIGFFQGFNISEGYFQKIFPKDISRGYLQGIIPGDISRGFFQGIFTGDIPRG